MQKRLKSLRSLCILSASVLLLTATPLAAKATSLSRESAAAINSGPFATLVRNSNQHTVTPAQIHAAFAKQIELNLAGDHGRSVSRRLSDKELVVLAQRYDAANGNVQAPTLLNELIDSAESSDLARLSAAFGVDRVHQVVRARSAPAVAMAYEQWYATTGKNLAATPTRNTTGAVMVAASGPAPTTDMTLDEIYLEFRTAPVGSLTITSSLSESAIFIGTKLSIYATAGYTAGTIANYYITTYDPSLGDAIGGTVAGMMEAIQSAGGSFAQGRYEQGLDNLFGGYIQESNDWSGDWDVSYSMSVYMGVPGCNFCIYNPD